jgi:hypothetical protein
MPPYPFFSTLTRLVCRRHSTQRSPPTKGRKRGSGLVAGGSAPVALDGEAAAAPRPRLRRCLPSPARATDPARLAPTQHIEAVVRSHGEPTGARWRRPAGMRRRLRRRPGNDAREDIHVDEAEGHAWIGRPGGRWDWATRPRASLVFGCGSSLR